MHWGCRRFWRWSWGRMQEVLGNKGSSGDAPGMQEALRDSGKRGSRSHRTLQAGAGDELREFSFSSEPLAIKGLGNSWILECLHPNKHRTGPAHHTSFFSFKLLASASPCGCFVGCLFQGVQCLGAAPGKGESGQGKERVSESLTRL